MTYNIINEEDAWKKTYAKHISGLNNTELLKEMRFVGNHFTNDDEEALEKKIRLSIISKIIESKLDIADKIYNGKNIILSEQEYKDLIDAAELTNINYNVCG